MQNKILSLLVDNTSGVLSRIAGMFSRRGYNIDSITAGVTADVNYTRITVVCLSLIHISTIGKKVRAYKEENPDKEVISLGIGDVTQPLVPAIIDALHGAVEEMAHAETFHGYAPDLGYEFLRRAIAKNDYQDRGCNIAADEIFVSDGAKSDSGNIQEIFGTDNKVAVCDPVYPVYVDTNVMAGRTGEYNTVRENFDGVIYMPCRKENGFLPEFPSEVPDLIYLCFPNNPTGSAITKDELQKWVDSVSYTHLKSRISGYQPAGSGRKCKT